MVAQSPEATTGVATIAARPYRASRRVQWARNLEIIVPGAFLVLLFGACYLWPLIGHVPSPTHGNFIESNQPPLSPGHILGTDGVGEDEFSRILYGGQISFQIAFATQLIGLALGGVIGVTAGYFGGWVDSVIMRVLDVVIAFPALVLALAIAEALGPSEINLIWAISFFTVPAFARLSRTAVLPLREQPFMIAANLSGVRFGRLLRRHIVPNILPRLVTYTFLGAGIAIIVAGSLSFLGIGVPPPRADWGDMISQGQGTLSAEPYLVIVPSVFLLATVVALNALGDGLRRRWGVR